MNNLNGYNEFKKKKDTSINENAQLIGDVWVVRPRIEIPSKFINDYFKKVKNETGVDASKKQSELNMAEDIASYLSNFLTIENIPVSLITGDASAPKTQSQVDMPAQADVAQPVEQVQGDANAAPAQPAPEQSAQSTAAPAQPAAPAPAPAQSAQAASQQIQQNEI